LNGKSGSTDAVFSIRAQGLVNKGLQKSKATLSVKFCSGGRPEARMQQTQLVTVRHSHKQMILDLCIKQGFS